MHLSITKYFLAKLIRTANDELDAELDAITLQLPSAGIGANLEPAPLDCKIYPLPTVYTVPPLKEDFFTSDAFARTVFAVSGVRFEVLWHMNNAYYLRHVSVVLRGGLQFIQYDDGFSKSLNLVTEAWCFCFASLPSIPPPLSLSSEIPAFLTDMMHYFG